MGWRRVSDCAAALRSREGATTVSWASSFSASTSARKPGAWMPSSLVIRTCGIRSRCGCGAFRLGPENAGSDCLLVEGKHQKRQHHRKISTGKQLNFTALHLTVVSLQRANRDK